MSAHLDQMREEMLEAIAARVDEAFAAITAAGVSPSLVAEGMERALARRRERMRQSH